MPRMTRLERAFERLSPDADSAAGPLLPLFQLQIRRNSCRGAETLAQIACQEKRDSHDGESCNQRACAGRLDTFFSFFLFFVFFFF